ncbi:Bestrophin-1 [Trichinella nelsoni]|uniref:Bestrophin homolog n=1 Tax=Trichinella nelsoni TaxID=6336 RepID=A0A0V0S9F1_9BILA|nr:Bestrophin-1 [Trichinella nelsoni]
MTVTYSSSCSNSTLSTFARLLLLWRGSVYKIIYKDLLIFLLLHYTLNLVYRHALDSSQQRTFYQISQLFAAGKEYIPITFVLSFFVNQIASRWWTNFLNICWPDSKMMMKFPISRIASIIGCYVRGNDERARLIRRTLVRYINLSALFVLRDISTAVKKRFPTMNHLVSSGFITETELKMHELSVETHKSVYLFWLPLQWAVNLVDKARMEGRIESMVNYKNMIREITQIRGTIGMMSALDWVPVPLVYTQVVTIAVYSFFLICLLSRQFDLNSDEALEASYFPFFTVLEFIFYVGLLKVAEVLLNPFGEDDDDFEVNYIIDRNIHISYLIVDDLYDSLPPIKEDMHWKKDGIKTPDTKSKLHPKRPPFKPSVAGLEIPLHLQSVVENNIEARGGTDRRKLSMADLVTQVMNMRATRQNSVQHNSRILLPTTKE